MTPEQHANAIEDAIVEYGEACIGNALQPSRETKARCLRAHRALRAATRAGVGAAPAAPDVAAELEEVKTVCAEAYQVVGALLADAGRFDSPEATKILDNLSEQRLRHTDVLPWVSKAAPEVWQPIETAPKGRKIMAGYFNEYGNWRSVMACFYEAGTLMTEDDCEDCDEDGYAHAGWYEESESHEHILPTDKPPTHWMALPPAPKP